MVIRLCLSVGCLHGLMVFVFLFFSFYFFFSMHDQLSHCHRHGRPTSPGKDLHLQETHPLPQLDWRANERYRVPNTRPEHVRLDRKPKKLHVSTKESHHIEHVNMKFECCC